MQLKTILNRVEPFKSFVYQRACFVETATGFEIEVTIAPRANGRPVCSGCGRAAPGYDRLPARRFAFIPLWAISVFFVYAMRRVNCPRCGVVVERAPWCDGKCALTNSYRWFLARWARRLSWKEVAGVFRTSWDSVFRSVKHAVFWGIVHREVTGVAAIGIDEIQCQRGHNYLTLVYQIDAGCRRLLWIGRERTAECLHGFFDWLGDESAKLLQYVVSDMWRAYLEVVRQRAGDAVHVLDRFHIMKKMNEAIDDVRRSEAKQLVQDGYEPILKHSRWCLLKRPENLTDKQTVKLSELVKYNLKSVRSYLLREDFQRFWDYASAGWAGKFLDQWCARAMRCRIEPMQKVAAMLRRHRELLLNWFRAQGQISAGIVEGFNNKAKLTSRKSYGFRNTEVLQIALYHSLADLPEPKFTHEFC
jgi:transposase